MKRIREQLSKAIFDKRGEIIEGQSFQSIDYNDVRFWGGDYRNCVWTAFGRLLH